MSPARPASKPTSRHAQHELRIVGGQWKRTRLPVLDAAGLRPTADRVRETLFNWLGQDLAGWRCLDAFAGSGALGFEAASRGAAEAVLVEQNPTLARSLRATQARLTATQVRIEEADTLRWMSRATPASFDLVLLDPPFEAQLFDAALRAAAPLVANGGWLYLEADRAFDAAALAEHGLALHRHLKAGASHAHLLRKPVPDAA